MGRMGSAVGGVLGTVGKFVPVLASAAGGVAAFEKTVNATQLTGDAFARVVTQASEGVNFFFASLARGDFSGFIDGLKDTIRYAGDVADAIDRLETTRITSGGRISIYDRQIAEARLEARKASLAGDVEGTKKWNDEELRLVEKKAAEMGRLAGDAFVAARNNIMLAVGKQKGDVGRLEGLTDEDILGFDQGQAAEDAAYIQGLMDRRDKLAAMKSNTSRDANARKRREDSSKALEDVTLELEAAMNSRAGLNYVLNQVPDEEMKQYTDRLREANGSLAAAVNQREGLLTRQERLSNKAEKASGRGSGGAVKSNVEDLLPEGSLAYVNSEIASLTKQLERETDARLRIGIQKAIDAKKKEKHYMLFDVRFNTADQSLKTPGLPVPAARNVASDLKSGYLDASRIGVSGLKETGYSDAIRKSTEDMKFYGDSIAAVNGLLNTLSLSADEAGQSTLKWMSAVLSAVGSLIPKIAEFTAARYAQAGAAQTAAVAEGAASVASVPYAGVALALAAIATLTAAFANMPKFADGGIVGGSSFVGDKLLARVNSGEMILNRAQQSGLLAGLGGGVHNVTFTLRGDELVGAINNHHRKYRR
jgi:hypothetical protein